jgi:hypothetical protein
VVLQGAEGYKALSAMLLVFSIVTEEITFLDTSLIARLLFFLDGIFASSLVALISISYIALDKPDSVRSFVKDIIPIVITPQATLLGPVFGAYMLLTRDKAKKDD